MNIFEKPWGNYIILLEDDNCKVKKITVKPGHRLSLQSHEKRNELWKIVQGNGLITLNDNIGEVTKGMTCQIPAKTKHRIENNSNEDLIFVEIQTGTYFGEDDIIRYEDSYGRI